MDPYTSIEKFERALVEWERARCLKERALFRKMMNLILEPLGRSTHHFPVGEQKSVELMLIARLFNDFEAAMRLTLLGLGEQAYMPMRDSIETMLLMKLFGIDSKLATRWVTDLKEYHASNVIAMLKKHGIDLPLNDLYITFSQLGHTNLLASVHVVEEVELGENQLLRTYHFGGMRSEGFIELQLRNLLVLSMIALVSVLAEPYHKIDPEFERWWEEVRSLPNVLKNELGIGIEYTEDQPSDRTARKISMKLNVQAFDPSSVNQSAINRSQQS